MKCILTEEIRSEIKKLSLGLARVKNPQPSLSLGIKTRWKNFGGTVEPLLLYAQADWVNGMLPDDDDWMAFRLEPLQEIVRNPDFERSQLQDAVYSCLVGTSASWASYDVLLHASFQPKYSCLVEPLSLLSFFLMKDGDERLKDAFQDRLEIVPLETLDKHLQNAISAGDGEENKALVIKNRGLFLCSSRVESCLSQLDTLLRQFDTILPVDSTSFETKPQSATVGQFETLPDLRKALATLLDHPVILHLDQTEEALSFSNNKEAQNLLIRFSPFSIFMCRSNFIGPAGESDKSLSTGIDPFSEKTTHCVTTQPGLGIVTAGISPAETRHTADVFRTIASAAIAALQNGELGTLPQEKIAQHYKTFSKANSQTHPFSGEIGLVTGAASGIGKASAESLLARGAVVVGLDINPDIKTTFNHPGYLGLVCDITNEDLVKQSMDTIVQTFGGLDILVLNAGLFPKGCPIHNIRLDEFNKVLTLNLTSNLVLMREAYPLLKRSPRYGRVVIIGSKNTKAPGPGAVAYSTSKAGVTQLARVAAIEWAPDGIRVNVIHPDAVFDTALYTEAVLKARADYYGITIEEYKKRNLLKTEITSHIIGEIVAEMCGKLFVATTGAQIQADGGNDRTI